MHFSFALAILLVARGFNITAYALASSDISRGPLQRPSTLGSGLDVRLSGQAIRRLGSIQRCQIPSGTPSSPSSTTSPSATDDENNDTSNMTVVDYKSWETQTATACDKAVRALNGKSLSLSGNHRLLQSTLLRQLHRRLPGRSAALSGHPRSRSMGRH